MSNDYGKKITKAFEAIYQLHQDVARLLQDCDWTIGKGKQSVFGNVITKDLSQSLVNPGLWMPAALYRWYDASRDSPGLVDCVTVYYWSDPPKHEEPLLILGQIKYHVEEGSLVGSVCKAWDLWQAYFEWCNNRRLDDVIAFKLDAEAAGRTEWFKLCAVPLFSVKSMEDVERLMSRVRQAHV
jgi:hypothetical protein